MQSVSLLVSGVANVASTRVNSVNACGIIVLYVDWFVTSAIKPFYCTLLTSGVPITLSLESGYEY